MGCFCMLSVKFNLVFPPFERKFTKKNRMMGLMSCRNISYRSFFVLFCLVLYADFLRVVRRIACFPVFCAFATSPFLRRVTRPSVTRASSHRHTCLQPTPRVPPANATRASGHRHTCLRSPPHVPPANATCDAGCTICNRTSAPSCRTFTRECMRVDK